jgi:molecular chaperone GrpE (heat shock protein)
MGAIAKMVGAKEDLNRRHEKQKSSIWSSIAGKNSNDFEEFMALERIREAEKELESMMKLYGRAGLWDDWQRYLAEARRERREAEAQRKKDIEKLWEYVAWVVVAIVLIGGFIGIVVWAKFLRDGGL